MTTVIAPDSSMNWNTRTFNPDRPPPRYPDRFRFTSPPLCRLFGSLGGTAIGLLAFRGGLAMFDLDRSFIYSGDWGFKEFITIAFSVMGMLFGFVMGLGLGMSISVRSARKNHVLTVLWHYVANGSILWLALLSLLLARILGRQGTIDLFERLGLWHASLLVFGNSACWCLAMAALLLANKQQWLYSQPSFLACLCVTLPLSLGLGHMQFQLLGLPGNKWILISIVLALILPLLSTQMIDRDLRQRQEMLTD